MIDQKILNKSNNQIFLKNGNLEINFSTVEECLFYTGYDLSDLDNVSYEPDRGFNHRFDGLNTTVEDIPDTRFETLLSEIALYQTRKDDPLYGLTGEALTAKQKELDEIAIRQQFATDSEAPVEVTVTEGTFTFNGGQDSASYIQGAVELAQALSETTVDITDINNVRRTLSFESANIVIVAIGNAFRTAFFAKQDALVALNN